MTAIVKAGRDLWTRLGHTTAMEGRSARNQLKIMQEVTAEGGFKIDIVSYMAATQDRDFIGATALSSDFPCRLGEDDHCGRADIFWQRRGTDRDRAGHFMDRVRARSPSSFPAFLRYAAVQPETAGARGGRPLPSALLSGPHDRGCAARFLSDILGAAQQA